MALIEVKEVCKNFKKNIVLDNVNISVNKGDILGILGSSGSGKSVLIKILTGFIKPDEGYVSLNARIGFSTQHNAIYDNLTLLQNLNYFARMYNVPKKKETIIEIISLLSLQKFKKTKVYQLSGGTKKRVDLACALLNDPEVLILDEPFSGLDTFLVNQLSNFLIGLKKKGKTIILSSHLLNQVETLCNKLIFIKEGKAIPINKTQLKNLY